MFLGMQMLSGKVIHALNLHFLNSVKKGKSRNMPIKRVSLFIKSRGIAIFHNTLKAFEIALLFPKGESINATFKERSLITLILPPDVKSLNSFSLKFTLQNSVEEVLKSLPLLSFDVQILLISSCDSLRNSSGDTP